MRTGGERRGEWEVQGGSQAKVGRGDLRAEGAELAGALPVP